MDLLLLCCRLWVWDDAKQKIVQREARTLDGTLEGLELDCHPEIAFHPLAALNGILRSTSFPASTKSLMRSW